MDHEHQVIVAAWATKQASDKQQAVALVEEAITKAGPIPSDVSADAGYYSATAVDGLCILGVDPFIAPENTRRSTRPEQASRGPIPSGRPPREAAGYPPGPEG